MLDEKILKITKKVEMRSLQYLAAVRVAIAVCESEDVQRMIGRFRNTNAKGQVVGFSDRQWRQLRGKVKRKLKQDFISDVIIDIVLENLWIISFQISKWILYHVEATGIYYSPNFYWTPQVCIDYLKTAQTLVKNETLDIKKRFKLACIYCIDTDVRSLFHQMSLSENRSFFMRGNLKKSNQNPIVLYWTYYIQQLPVDYWDSKALKETHVFKYAVENGYLRATKYFLAKIKENLKTRMIFNCFSAYLRELYYPEFIVRDHLAIVCFLMSLHPKYCSSKHFFSTLLVRTFLEWPLQKHFLKVIDRVRYPLAPKNIGEVLEGIFEKDIGGFKDFDYKELFKGFWHMIFEEDKIYLNTESKIGYKIFMKFFKKHFGFVFEEDSFAIKAKFRSVISQQEISRNEKYFGKENVEFFKFLVQERVTTKSSINRFSQLQDDFMIITFQEYGPGFNLPLGELMYLIDGILESV